MGVGGHDKRPCQSGDLREADRKAEEEKQERKEEARDGERAVPRGCF